ncbi:hypothetical protein BsWGS_19467 [Bradybaena similaris]
MSVPHAPPVVGGHQERQNRIILEHIQGQKKRLQYGHHGSSSSVISPAPRIPSSTAPLIGPSAAEYASITNAQQRTALEHAHGNSVGYFITQDSSFGNLILPVLPRIPDAKIENK